MKKKEKMANPIFPPDFFEKSFGLFFAGLTAGQKVFGSLSRSVINFARGERRRYSLLAYPPSKKQMAPYSALISQRYRINFVEWLFFFPSPSSSLKLDPARTRAKYQEGGGGGKETAWAANDLFSFLRLFSPLCLYIYIPTMPILLLDFCKLWLKHRGRPPLRSQ